MRHIQIKEYYEKKSYGSQKKGVPDYVIFINNNNENTIIWIEMKTKKGVQSPEQKTGKENK